MPKLRQDFMRDNLRGYNGAMKIYQEMTTIFGKDTKIALSKDKAGYIDNHGVKHTMAEVEQDITDFSIAYEMAKLSKTILFPSEQVEVFVSLLNKNFDIPLEYKLPFTNTLIEFTSPVEVTGIYGTKKALGLLLEQQESDERSRNDALQKIANADELFGFDSRPTLPLDYSKDKKIVINAGLVIYEGLDGERLAWTSQNPNGLETCEEWDAAKESHMKQFKRLIIACIGYINCENVYLAREGGTDEATNARRVSKGKSRLEPYYVCRIRGVQYDGNGATGKGSKQSIRYDVRGHFRRLTDGKTTWVRPHQRGLENELYVPKTYLVDKPKVES